MVLGGSWGQGSQPQGSSADGAPEEGQGRGPGPLLFAGMAGWGSLTMASPTTLKTSTLARSRALSEKWLLSRPMTRPWMTWVRARGQRWARPGLGGHLGCGQLRGFPCYPRPRGPSRQSQQPESTGQRGSLRFPRWPQGSGETGPAAWGISHTCTHMHHPCTHMFHIQK